MKKLELIPQSKKWFYVNQFRSSIFKLDNSEPQENYKQVRVFITFATSKIENLACMKFVNSIV